MALNRFFKIEQRGSTIGTEILGGASTFMALSYIIIVQPTVMSVAGMEPGAVMVATCVCSSLACLVMGLAANLPIALAPAMGHNFFFAFTVCGLAARGGFGLSWQEALAANFAAGVLFLVLSLLGLRKAIMDAIPEGLKFAIAVGIGLLITMVGLEWSGIIVASPATYITLGGLHHPVTLLSLFGLLVMGFLLSVHFRGAILVGMLVTAGAGFLATKIWGGGWDYALVSGARLEGFPDVSATAGKFIGGFGSLTRNHHVSQVILVIFTFLLLDLFDTIGTLVGLGERAGLMQDGQLPQAREAMMADAVGTLSGAALGTSTITSYIESTTGIVVGARTGLASIVTAALLLLSMFAYPLVSVLGTAVTVPAGELGAVVDSQVNCYPIIAPVLIVVGCFMVPMVKRIDWDNFAEALPALLTIVIMQFSWSITDGIAWGFISYTLLKLLSGKMKQCPWIVTACSVLFVLYYAFWRI